MSPSPVPETAAAPVEEQQTEKKVEESAPAAEEKTEAAAEPAAEKETNGDGDVEMEEPAEEAEKEESKPESSKTKAAPKSAGRPGPGSKGAKGKAAQSESSKFEANDIILAKLKGYPKWPAKVVAEDDIPLNVRSERSGKGYHCVRFFPAGDYAWLATRDLTHLKSHEISAFLSEPSKAKKDLHEAYKVAQDPVEWEAEKDAEQEAADEAAAEEEEGVDELEDGEEATGGKRKRAEPKKKDATKKKAKLESLSKKKKEESEEAPASKKKPAAKTKAAKADKKPVSAAEEEDDPLAKDPEAVKVKEWRHRLQRAFLSKGLPTESEMGTYSQLFTTIEEYGDKMTVPYLQHSKIGKVMKKIALLKDLPNGDEFKITSRAATLMETWSKILDPAAANGDKSADQTASEPAKENGDAPAEESAPAEAVEAAE